MKKERVIQLAKQAGLPAGWYQGPYFDANGTLVKEGPPCLFEFVRLVLVDATKTEPKTGTDKGNNA